MASPSRPDRADPHGAIKRELLVRLLDGWLPAALHGTGRATYLDANPTPDSVTAALRVTVEFADLLDRHRLDVVLVDANGGTAMTAETALIERSVAPPPGVSVRIIPGAGGGRLPTDVSPRDGPMLAYLDLAGTPAPAPETLAALATGGHTQALVALDPSVAEGRGEAGQPWWAGDCRTAVAGTGAACCVELVGPDGRTEVLIFRAPTPRGLEAFKDALWAADEYAGVRYRDPGDPEHALLDISLNPHPGPLRRALLRHLAAVGDRTVAQLRRYALTETIYRPADVAHVLTAMVTAGTVTRAPAKGRLTADTVLSPR